MLRVFNGQHLSRKGGWYAYALLQRFLALILAWVSALVYQALLVPCAAHPLVCLARRYNPAGVVAACSAYYHHVGPGAPPTISVHSLVCAEIVRA